MTCNSCRSSAKRSLMIIINACAHVRSLRSHIRIYINRFPHCNPSCDLPVTQIHMPRPPRASKDLYISLLSKGGARINKTLIELHPFKSKFHFRRTCLLCPFSIKSAGPAQPGLTGSDSHFRHNWLPA